MIDGNEHSEQVDSWLRAGPQEPPLLLSRFEFAFSAILRRAHQTLGEVTLLAILDRVLYVASEQFPLVAKLEIEGTTISCRRLHERICELPLESLVAAVRFVLVEFLTVIGTLTAEIMTPALHAELHASQEAPRGSVSEESPRQREKDDEGVRS